MMGYSDIMYASQVYYSKIFMLTVSTFVVIFVYQIFALLFMESKSLWKVIIHTIGFCSEAALLIATIVYYGLSLNAYN
jgi:hypothetical protein